ncbi:MAG: phosphoribosylformylglycinamidine synthase I [Anaerolineales bacterium]|nr:phosphoribosylformylglycinamidine synthase I [Anaerolineales bacterium]
MKPQALILHANGINRDIETAAALEKAGAEADTVHLNQLREGGVKWSDYQILVIPGGFSYADALGGGKLMALEMNVYFADQVREFVESGKPVLGICNGFQALVKSGILPGAIGVKSAAKAKAKAKAKPKTKAKLKPKAKAKPAARGKGVKPVRATLTFNQSGRFECRWVHLQPVSKKCVWTDELDQLIYCPVAHGEGRFLLQKAADLKALRDRDMVALTYVLPDGSPAKGEYPVNPNGSLADIAGVCNEKGNVLGLMPHPEDHIHAWQHPRFTRGESGLLGLALYENGVYYAEEM